MKKILFFAAAAVALLTGCSQNDDLTAPTVAQNAQQQTAIEFGTYVGNAPITRSTIGATGNQTTTTLGTNGFGVFAYYTGTYNYGQRQGTTYTGESSPQADIAPNFMYNQQVTDTDHDGTWTYAPLKYWPNGNENADNAGAVGSEGGKVSFFAYAPYVASAGDPSGDDGIVGITSNSTDGDPKITYKMSNVDLLWGTLSSADVTVNNVAQNGVSYDKDAAANTYKKSILPHETTPGSGTYDGYTLAADLTKQKMSGKINFSFKHALAAIGGGSSSVGVGFQAVLDVDEKVNGSNQREKFTVSSTDDAWRTIVTIKNITITNDADGSGAINGEEVGLYSTGVLNLATGIWTTLPANQTGILAQTIKAKATADTEAEINSKIAEYKAADGTTTFVSDYTGDATKNYFITPLTSVNTGDHPGVTETAQNVYASNTQVPLLLIPGVTPKFKITVSYVVRTYDENLNSKYSEVSQTVTKTITFAQAVQLNKRYNLIMHLGLTSVKFTATVADWENGTIADSDGDSTPDNNVFLPINVE